MNRLRFAFWVIGLLVAIAMITPKSHAAPALPAGITMGSKGSVHFDEKSWREEKQSDGTQLLTFKNKPEAKIAVMRAASGELESFTSYKLKPSTKKGESGSESSSSMVFSSGHLEAYTTCEEMSEVGRVCVTATPKLCGAFKTGDGLTPEIIQNMDDLERKSLAVILTLRGSDHQLDNMVKSGNRLGLKSALQTTRGQLIALAQQVALETGKVTPAAATRNPANDRDTQLTRKVLEQNLPRLKETCVSTGFTR